MNNYIDQLEQEVCLAADKMNDVVLQILIDKINKSFNRPIEHTMPDNADENYNGLYRICLTVSKLTHNGYEVYYGTDGIKYFYYGALHRECGPAEEFYDGRKYWYYYGVPMFCYSQGEFENIIKYKDKQREKILFHDLHSYLE